jgi:hypothetical protein
MVKTERSKYKIIEDAGKKYILVSQASDYAREGFGMFGIPSYRTIRYYIMHGILERPQKLGKETYFELDYIIGAIGVMRMLMPFRLSVGELRSVMSHVRKLNQYEKVAKLIHSTLGKFLNREAKEEFINQLSIKELNDIDIDGIAKKYPEFDDR